MHIMVVKLTKFTLKQFHNLLRLYIYFPYSDGEEVAIARTNKAYGFEYWMKRE